MPGRGRTCGPGSVLVASKETGMTKPILVVTTRYPKAIEDRIDRDYSARRNPNQFPFSQQDLLAAAEGADALFITPADRLDSGFFQKVSTPSCMAGLRQLSPGPNRRNK